MLRSVSAVSVETIFLRLKKKQEVRRTRSQQLLAGRRRRRLLPVRDVFPELETNDASDFVNNQQALLPASH